MGRFIGHRDNSPFRLMQISRSRSTDNIVCIPKRAPAKPDLREISFIKPGRLARTKKTFFVLSLVTHFADFNSASEHDDSRIQIESLCLIQFFPFISSLCPNRNWNVRRRSGCACLRELCHEAKHYQTLMFFPRDSLSGLWWWHWVT